MNFLASKPASLRKCPVLGSKTALFFNFLKKRARVRTFFCRHGARKRPRGKCLTTFNFMLQFVFGKRINFAEYLQLVRAKKFFFWRTFVRGVLPLPWPQAFLPLASRGSVLGLGLGFFLGPWPQALSPGLHLWQQYH